MAGIDHHFHRVESDCAKYARTIDISDVQIADMFASAACDRALMDASRRALKETRELLSRVNRKL